MVFLIHVGSSLMMTGLIWFVQIVHYPLFLEIPREHFSDYERLHQLRTGWLVAPLMLMELGTGAWVLFQHLNSWVIWAEMGLLLLIWASTFFIQMPLHRSLGKEVNPAKQTTLVHSNWFRTVAWSLRAVLLLSLV